MKCNCGSELEHKTHEKEGITVTTYTKCKGCGFIRILADTTGKAVIQALRANKGTI